MEIHENDSLLPGVTYDDLITMVHCNEPEITENAIIRSFENLVYSSIYHARKELKKKMDFIIESVNEDRE